MDKHDQSNGNRPKNSEQYKIVHQVQEEMIQVDAIWQKTSIQRIPWQTEPGRYERDMNLFQHVLEKKRKNFIQLETTQIEHFKQYWGRHLYTETQNKTKFLSIKDHI